MKLFLKKIALITLPLILLFLGSFVLLQWHVKKPEYFLIPKDRTSIIIGHSHATHSYNDSFIDGFYNVAQNAEGYPYSFFKIKKILKCNNHIKNICIEFTNNQISQWAVDRISGRYLKFNMERALPFLDKKFALKTFYHSASISEISSSIISSYRQNIDFILKDNKSFIDFVWRINTTTDHVYKGDTAPVRHNFQETFENIYAIEEENIRYLFKLKQLCEEKGVQLIFIRSPGLKHLQSKNESILMHMKKTFFPNIPFLDFRNYPLDIKLFADEQHLNRNGKNKFTRFFNDSIAREGFSDIDKLKRIILRNSIATSKVSSKEKSLTSQIKQ